LAIQVVKSKLNKTRLLMKDDELRKYIPVTRKLSKKSLFELLTEYTMVYVKPDRGKGGAGVMRVEGSGGDMYKVQYGTKTYRYSSADRLYAAILQRIGTKRYLVQQGIPLLKYKERPFDIRVLIQRNLQGKWEMTGVIGRVAHPSRIVTNYYRGGTPLAFQALMKIYLSNEEQAAVLEQLQSMGILIARFMKKKYPGIKEIGLDVGLDADYHPWLIEVNTIPNPFLFRKLPDKSMYRKIRRYAVAYGRFDKRYCPKYGKRKTS
jgi:glutathione synthase/RimK-type ligase-like ATP-grasp enzyme